MEAPQVRPMRAHQATREMLFTPDPVTGLSLVDRFDALLLDNASIHHADWEFLDELNLYIKILFIPPYCYHLSPLDNGAYGCA